MKNELIKQAFRLGNSAGIILPKDWDGRKVSVRLIDKSLQQEIIEILEEENLLKDTIGVYLAGSYARNEETEMSDIDVLVITGNINKQLKKGKYDFIFVSKDKFEKSVMKSLYLASLTNEAKVILNADFLNRFKDEIWKVSIKKHLKELESVTSINKKFVALDKELNELVGDETIYSLVLRLRELYLIECLRKRKMPSNKIFIDLLKKIATEESYGAYLRVKNNMKTKKIIPVSEAMALINEIMMRINNLKHGKKS